MQVSIALMVWKTQQSDPLVFPIKIYNLWIDEMIVKVTQLLKPCAGLKQL